MRLEDRSAGRWCAECQQHGSHHTDKHAEFAPEPREDVAEVLAEWLSWTSGEMTRYSPAAHEDHNRWSWRGDGHGDAIREQFRQQAEALAPLIAERVRAAAVEALREAADDLIPFPGNDYGAFPWGVQTWLRDRADRRAER